MVPFKVLVLSFLFLLNSVHSMKGNASGRRVVRILSIDGGGLRNVIPLTVLNSIEECLAPHASLSDCFDIVTGISTGGVVALGLNFGKSPREILNLYKTQAFRIFSKSSETVGSKYDAISMKHIFQEFFEDKWLSNCTLTAIVPVYDLGVKYRYTFNSSIAKKRSSNDFLIADIAVATSADQNFFPPAVAVDKTKLAEHTFVDGGYYDIDPVSEAIKAADEQYPDCDFYILSLGTGEVPRRYGDLLSRDGHITWNHTVIQEILTQQRDSQRLNLENLRQSLLLQRRELHYHRVPLPIPEDLATVDNIDNINSLIQAGLALLSQANEFFPVKTQAEIVNDLLSMKSEFPRLPDQYRTIRRTIHNLASADVLRSFISSSRLGSDLSYTGELEAIFREGSNAITITSQGAVVGGMGGIGKSTLALNYAYTKKDFYDCIFWIHSVDDTNLMEGYKEILRRLGISYNESDALKTILEKLEEELREKRYLLVYDDVPDNVFLNGKIPVGDGHVLITSRCQSSEWKNSIIRMDVFQPSEAVDYLFKSININVTDRAQLIRTPQLETEARELSELLEHLPLALSHASAYMKYVRTEGENYTFKDYIKDFSDALLILLDGQYSRAQGEENVDYQHLIAKTLAVAQKRISKFSKLCGTILDYCAYLDRNNILQEFFDECIKAKQREIGELKFVKPFADLTTFSLITLISDRSFSIHGLVQKALLDKQTPREKEQNIREVSRMLSDKVRRLYVTDRNSYDRILKYMLNVSALLDASKKLTPSFEIDEDLILAEKVLYYMIKHSNVDFYQRLKVFQKKDADSLKMTLTLGEVSQQESMSWLQKAEEKGFIDAMEKLGMFYFWNNEDYDKIISKFRAAANQGHAGAQSNLGVMYLSREIMNTKLAFDCFMKAAEQGYAEAQHNLGTMYSTGMFVSINKKLAFDCFMKAAKQGLRQAQYNVGEMYFNGDYVVKDQEKGFEWFIKAAKQEYPLAQYAIGLMYYHGMYLEKNQQKAFEWFVKAASQECAEAEYCLAKLYEKGGGITQEDKKIAFKWYMNAASHGHAVSQNILGIMYSKGEVVPVDMKQAFYWYMEAAKQGVSEATQNLRTIYYTGKCVEEDKRQLLEWLISQGDVSAMNNLGDLYEKSGDYVNALYWYQQAADHGNDCSACSLGLFYKLDLNGIEKSSDVAQQWFLRAAEHGNCVGHFMIGKSFMKHDSAEKARLHFDKILSTPERNYYYWGALGLMYLYGYGIEQDIEKAAECFIEKLCSIDADDSLAKYCLLKLEKIMTVGIDPSE